MSYDARETSQSQGAPIECYRFISGPSVYLTTSGDKKVQVTIEGSLTTFEPRYARRSAIEEGREDSSGTIEVVLDRLDPVALLFRSYAPVEPVTIEVFRFHEGDTEIVEDFAGVVAAATFEGGRCTLSCKPEIAIFERKIPRTAYQKQCPWATYSAPCGISAADFRDMITLGTVDGTALTAAAFAAHADGWYEGGWIERANGEKRFITAHVGDTVSIQSPFTGLAAGEVVSAFAGDDHLEQTCRTKFNNIAHFWGFPRKPDRNPFENGVG